MIATSADVRAPTGWTPDHATHERTPEGVVHGLSERRLAYLFYQALRRDAAVTAYLNECGVALDDVWRIIARRGGC